MKVGLVVVALVVAVTPTVNADTAARSCLDGGEPQGASFHRTLTSTTHKRETPDVVSGNFIGEFSVALPSCVGVDYVLHLDSYDGTPLDVQTFAPSPESGHAALTPDGSSVTISYPGDTSTETFLTHVTTGPGYINPCVSSYVTIEIAGRVLTRSLTVLDCDNGSADEGIYFVP